MEEYDGVENKEIENKEVESYGETINTESKEEKIDKIIKLALIRIGIKCDHFGFILLTESVKEAIKKPNTVRNMKNLFTIVAKRCGVKSYIRVESNIHNAIDVAYKKHGFDFINTIYGTKVLKDDHKPSVAELIRLLSEYYTLGLYKKDYKFSV